MYAHSPLTLISSPAVQQSSYYGLSGMLPSKYAQAVMAGESVAGVVVSINRIITKAAIHSERTGAITFFAISLGFVMACVGCQLYILRSPFVRYHIARCEGQKQKAAQVHCRAALFPASLALLSVCSLPGSTVSVCSHWL